MLFTYRKTVCDFGKRNIRRQIFRDKRVSVPISKLRVGLKCGGSDGFSGITANPLVGRFCDKLTSFGGSCVLTEVPEMFGAEHLLMNRAENEEVFEKTVALINNFKDYYERHNQVIYENPSPGNKAGGITTLEEKSLGCVQKGGLSKVVDVLDYGDKLTKNGLSLLKRPRKRHGCRNEPDGNRCSHDFVHHRSWYAFRHRSANCENRNEQGTCYEKGKLD